MTNLTPSAAPSTELPVRLTRMGGDTMTLDYRAGQTVGQYVDRAEMIVNREDAITMGGRAVKLDDIVEPGQSVVVAGRVSNG